MGSEVPSTSNSTTTIADTNGKQPRQKICPNVNQISRSSSSSSSSSSSTSSKSTDKRVNAKKPRLGGKQARLGGKQPRLGGKQPRLIPAAKKVPRNRIRRRIKKKMTMFLSRFPISKLRPSGWGNVHKKTSASKKFHLYQRSKDFHAKINSTGGMIHPLQVWCIHFQYCESQFKMETFMSLLRAY